MSTSALRVARASSRAVALAGRRFQSTGAAAPVSTLPLNNIEASWKGLSTEERYGVFKALEEKQKIDWRELSLDEKRAAYFVSFGPHGPRAPIVGPNSAFKTFLGVSALIATAGALFYGLRQLGGAKPKTLTKEWKEAENERLIEQKSDPITGISSEGYKGKGML